MPTEQPAAKGPLAGIRVIDMTTVLMGPVATRILGDYGADVIKIEAPDGDIMRKAPPMRHEGMGAVYLNCNRNKRSVVLDVRQAEGRAVLLKLLAGADVLVSNIRPAAMRRLKLDYADVAAVNPRIVYASLVGFRQDGPYAAKPAYDDLIQGACGLAALFQRVGGEPLYVPSLLADRIVGISAVHAILAALFHRERSGEGQLVEVPMFETMAEQVLGDHLGGLTFEPRLGPTGYERLLSANRRPCKTKDGYIAMLVHSDRQWEAFFTAVGREHEFRENPKLHDIDVRVRHYDEVYGMVGAIVATRTSAEWLEIFEKADIPAMPLHDVEGLMHDPQLQATRFIAAVEHPSEGPLRTTAPAARFSRTPQDMRAPAPRLGEHSREVLLEAGYTGAEIDALIAGGTIAAAD